MRILAPTIDHRHDVRGLLTTGVGTGEKSNVSLSMYFIDLHKAYDSVIRTLLWEVLAGFGVLPWMIEVIHIFHNGMRAREDPGQSSAWFHVCQALKEEYVSAALLFNIFGAALVYVIVHRFAADPAIVPGLIFSDDAPVSDNGDPLVETPLEEVRRAVWAMLKRNDAGTVSRSPDGL